MMSRFAPAGWWLGIVGMLLCSAAQSWPVEPPPVPPSMFQVIRNSAHIAGQLRLAVHLGKYVLEELSTVDEAEPLDNIVGSARNVYVLIRAARAGMEHQRDARKAPSPLLEYAYNETTSAWNLARLPVDRSHDRLPRAQYLNEAIRSLRQAIEIVERVLQVYR